MMYTFEVKLLTKKLTIAIEAKHNCGRATDRGMEARSEAAGRRTETGSEALSITAGKRPQSSHGQGSGGVDPAVAR
jgi:hypothetical protein